MQLRRLELVGFKTFVTRTELEFHPGVTAIVGPNGSGKSNIFDGIRWALGETNARMLRGARMEDVIFAGSASRRPHTLAEVSLTLDNGAGLLPLEFSEVTVSRTVTRGGEGQYALNGLDCRLRDIQMLFLGTGLGGRSYALIGQGEVDAVLRATPVERRQWLEEAAGLARHKRQRVEAERRLARAQTYLERLTDLVAELEAQQQALAAQAEAAMRHHTYTQELRDLEVALFADEARRLLGAVRRLGDQLARDRDALAAAARGVAEAAAAVASSEARLAQANAAWENRQQALLDGVERLSARAADLQALDARIEGLRARRDHLAADGERLAATLDRTGADADVLRRDAKDASRDRDARELALQDAETSLEAASKDATEAEARLAQARADGVEMARTLAQTGSDLAALRARSEALRQAIATAAQKTAALEETADRLARDQRVARQTHAEARAAAERAEAALAGCLRTLDDAQRALAVLTDEARAAELEEHGLRARLAALQEAHEQFAGFEDGVRAVLLAARSHPEQFPGLRGAVADLLDVPNDYRTAIAAALGRRLHCLVVDRRSQIDAIMRFLQAKGRGPAGRGAATVLALDVLRPRSPDAHREKAAPEHAADVVRAVDIVTVPDGLRSMVETLLGDIAIVADLSAAWRLYDSGFGGRIAIRDGTALLPDGVLSILGRPEAPGAPLGRGQTITEYHEALARIERRRAEVDVRHHAATEQVSVAETALTGARAEHERALAISAERGRESERLDAEAARLADERQTLVAEDRPRETALARLQTDIERLEAHARGLETEARRLDGQMKAQQADVARATTAREAAASALTAHRMALVALEGRCESLRARLSDREAAMEELRRRQADLAADGDRLTDELASVGESRARAAVACDELRASQAGGKADIERLSAERARLRDEVGVHQAAHQAAVEAQREAETAAHRTEVRQAQADAELGAAAGRLEQEFGVSLEAAAAHRLEGSREEVQRRLEAVRAALRDLGPVNLRAIDEHAAVTGRLEALRAQTDDLRDAGEALRQAIAHINAALRAGFRQTFEEVDREFGRLFQRLFEGGEGHLELVEAEPGAEPGLEVIAQLPGKTRRALVALSGGERVLVALALIFAMLRVHPSPFCIFDEVEAALDDANTKRFTTLLRDLAEHTQVLIITHNKGTMAASDVLYGVTMQEPGISSLVSVRLVPSSENAERREREPVGLPAE